MPDCPILHASIRHRIAGLGLEVAFSLREPWTVLFAPSGAGKTTILRILAGLDRAAFAQIAWTGTPSHRATLTDTAQNLHVPPHARFLPMVTQHPALFPHFTVAKNVTYGSRTRAGHSPEARPTLGSLLELCQIAHLAAKLPHQLSGGERQRVSLARALGAQASAILLDEPFSGLDGSLKDRLMQDVKAWLKQRNTPVLQVTHDVSEVFAVADDVIRLSHGKVVAQGTPNLTLAEERERMLARLTSRG